MTGRREGQKGCRDALWVDDAWYREDVFSRDPGSRRTSVRRARAERIARTICGGEQSPVSQKRFGPKAANQGGDPLAESTAALNLAALCGVSGRLECPRAAKARKSPNQPGGVANRPVTFFLSPTNHGQGWPEI